MSKTEFSLDEISRYNGVLDARTWIIIRGSVYDVTDYLNQHPGGRELIMEYGGTDATTAFNEFGHSSDARNTMKMYKIGRVIKEDALANNKRRNITILQDKTNDAHIKNTKRQYLRILFPLFRSCSS